MVTLLIFSVWQSNIFDQICWLHICLFISEGFMKERINKDNLVCQNDWEKHHRLHFHKHYLCIISYSVKYYMFVWIWLNICQLRLHFICAKLNNMTWATWGWTYLKDMGLKQLKCQEKGVLAYRKKQREALNSFSTEAFFSQHLSREFLGRQVGWPGSLGSLLKWINECLFCLYSLWYREKGAWSS